MTRHVMAAFSVRVSVFCGVYTRDREQQPFIVSVYPNCQTFLATYVTQATHMKIA